MAPNEMYKKWSFARIKTSLQFKKKIQKHAYLMHFENI